MDTEFPSAEVLIEAAFHDVDPMAVVWHGNYVKYFEIARCHLLDMINYNYPEMQASGYAWPVIDMRVRYARPVRFRQKIKVKATITEIDPRLMVKFLITDAETGERLTRGYTSQVALDLKTGEMLLAPPDILERCIEKWNESQPQNAS